MTDCGLCQEPGATKLVKDAAGTPHVVHRRCWLQLQQTTGALMRNLTPRGRKTANFPTEVKG